MNQYAIGREVFHRHAAELFVGAVHGVPGLEGHYALPAALINLFANRHGGTECLGKVLFEVGVIQHFDRTRDHGAALRGKGGHTGMFGIIGAEDLGEDGGNVAIAQGLDGLDGHDRQQWVAFAVWVSQRQTLTRLDGAALCEVDHRHRPKEAVGRGHVFGDR